MENEFRFAIQPEDPTGVIIEKLLSLQGSIDALAILVIETNAIISEQSVVAVAERFEQLTNDCVLRRSFQLQERYAAANRSEGQRES